HHEDVGAQLLVDRSGHDRVGTPAPGQRADYRAVEEAGEDRDRDPCPTAGPQLGREPVPDRTHQRVLAVVIACPVGRERANGSRVLAAGGRGGATTPSRTAAAAVLRGGFE